MPTGRHSDAGSRVTKQRTVMLRIDCPGDNSPTKFPAVVRNLVTGVATLEVNNPWTILNWESLKGLEGRLHLLAETGEITELPGIMTWVRYTVTNQENGQLCLGLKLADPDPAAQKLLNEHILHTSEDIKTLWERWDKVRRTPEPEAFSTKFGFIAASLLLGFVAVNLLVPSPYKFFGWVLWLSGALVVASQTLQVWKSRKTAR